MLYGEKLPPLFPALHHLLSLLHHPHPPRAPSSSFSSLPPPRASSSSFSSLPPFLRFYEEFSSSSPSSFSSSSSSSSSSRSKLRWEKGDFNLSVKLLLLWLLPLLLRFVVKSYKGYDKWNIIPHLKRYRRGPCEHH